MTELWRYRGFILDTVKRQFQARYMNSALGGLWAVIHPLAMVLIYAVILGRLIGPRLGASDDPMAYGVFLCAGVITWSLFSEVVQRCLLVFVDHADLVKKARFPRATLPLIALFSASIDFVLTFAVLLVLLAASGRFPGWAVVAVLPLVLVQQAMALGVGLSLGVVNVFFRDVRHAVSVLLPVWFWLTPIVYPVQILGEQARYWLHFNPLTDLVIAYQQIVLQGAWPDGSRWILPAVAAGLALGTGALAFRRLSADMADYL